MNWPIIWTVWFAASVVAFAILEGMAIHTSGLTLSRCVYLLAQKWPPIMVVYGIVMGGLAVHFFWIWNPQTGVGG